MKVFIAILFLLPFISYAQEIEQLPDSLTHQNDIVIEEIRETSTEIEQITDTLSNPFNEVKQIADTVEQISTLGGLPQGKINMVNDSIQDINALLQNEIDTLESVQAMIRMEKWKKDFLDSLKLYDLPEELNHYIDSIQDLTNVEDRIKSKIKNINPADTIDSPVVDQIGEILAEESSEWKNDLLPPEFYDKLSEYKDKLNPDLDSFLSEKTSEFTQIKSDINLDALVNTDLNFIDDLKINEWSNKLDFASDPDNNVIPEIGFDKLDISSDELSAEEYADLMEKLDTEEYQKLVEEYGSLSEDELDKRIEEQLTKIDEVNELGLNGDVNLESIKNDQFEQLEQLDRAQNLMNKIAQKKERVLANEVIEENMDLVQEAQKASDKLLGKYVKLENSNDLDNGVKSFASQKTFWQRWIYGGNLQVNPGEKISLDMSPFLAYQINDRAVAGFGGTFRYEFLKEENYLPDMDREPEYGYRVFSQYKVIKSFFVHGEWERLNNYNENGRKEWMDNYLAGIGKQIILSEKLIFTVSFLYNFNHKNSESYNRPIMLRMGFQKR